MESVAQTYTQRAATFREQLRRLDQSSARLANARLLVFLTATALAIAAWRDWVAPQWVWACAALIGSFIAMVVWHSKVVEREGKARTLLELCERALARMGGKWHTFESRGDAYASAEHPYATDLDVFGQGSLFQKLDETGTRWGEATLAQWLSAAASIEEIAARQHALRELKGRIDFRHRLVADARALKRAKADPTSFIEWTETPGKLDRLNWVFVVAHVLPLVTVALFALEQWVGPAGWGSLLVQLALVLLTRGPLSRLYEQVVTHEHDFARFDETFATLDAEPFSDPLLRSLQAGQKSDGLSIAARLKRFLRIFGFAQLRSSPQLHWVINTLFLWDIHALFRLERWRQSYGQGARKWFTSLAHVEALCSMAAFCDENPDCHFPQVGHDGPIEAKGLGHALLEAPVASDVSMPAHGFALIVTGSNMSGKTTLLRSLGLACVMAGAGLPVRSASMRLPRLNVVTGMRVKDSLERGVSYFYAEVQRLKTIFDLVGKAPSTSLVLLDEILLGTNTRERQIASRAVLERLVGLGARVAVTTHDLTLCELEQALSQRARNVHFRDQLENGKMSFDYQLRDGVVTTSNALEVLRLAGVPIS